MSIKLSKILQDTDATFLQPSHSHGKKEYQARTQKLLGSIKILKIYYQADRIIYDRPDFLINGEYAGTLPSSIRDLSNPNKISGT